MNMKHKYPLVQTSIQTSSQKLKFMNLQFITNIDQSFCEVTCIIMASVVIHDEAKNVIDENKETDDTQDNDELIEWLQENDLADIQHALIQRKYRLLTLKYLNDEDLDAVIEDLATPSDKFDDVKLTVPQKLRFKAAVKKLVSQPPKKGKSRHYKSSKSEYTYSVDLKEFYSTTQTITIIGGSRVGKSSLKDVIMGRKFDKDKFPTIRMTEKPELFMKQIKRMKRAQSAPEPRKDINVKYHIWDCPGQKALEHIPPLYLTGLVVFAVKNKICPYIMIYLCPYFVCMTINFMQLKGRWRY